MTQDKHVEQFQSLTKRVEEVKTALSVLVVRQQEAQKSATAVLAKHGCKTVEEFEALVSKKEKELEAATAALETQVSAAEKRVAEIDAALKN